MTLSIRKLTSWMKRRPLRIGGFLPWDAKPTGVTIVSWTKRREYRVVRGGHVFLVTASPFRWIDTVHSASPGFTTPEGVLVGKPMRQVREVAVGAPLHVASGIWVIELPSGWQAQFRTKHLMEDTPVSGLGKWWPLRGRAG